MYWVWEILFKRSRFFLSRQRNVSNIKCAGAFGRTSFSLAGTFPITHPWHHMCNAQTRIFHRGQILASTGGLLENLLELWPSPDSHNACAGCQSDMSRGASVRAWVCRHHQSWFFFILKCSFFALQILTEQKPFFFCHRWHFSNQLILAPFNLPSRAAILPRHR